MTLIPTPIPYADRFIPPPPTRPWPIIVLGLSAFLIAVLGVVVGLYVLKDAQLLELTREYQEPVAVVPAAPNLEPYDGEFLPPSGLSHRDRETVLAAVRERERIGLDCEEMLRRLLAEIGRDAFVKVSSPMTPASARAAIGSVDFTNVDPRGERRKGMFRIKVPGGEIGVANLIAFFRRADGQIAEVSHSFKDYRGKTQMPALAIQDNLDRLRKHPLTPMQAAGLAQAMREWAGVGGHTALAFTQDQMLGFGTFGCHLRSGRTEKPGTNVVVLSNGYYRTAESLDAVNPQTGGPRIVAAPSTHLAANRPAVCYMLLDASAAIVLGLVLLVASAMIMFDSAYAREVLLAWAVLKLAAAVVLVAVSAVFVVSISPENSYPVEMAYAMRRTAVVYSVAGLIGQSIFPAICLAVLLGSSSVDRYFRYRGVPPFAMLARLLSYIRHRLSPSRGTLRLVIAGAIGVSIVLHFILAVLLFMAQGTGPATLVALAGLGVSAIVLFLWQVLCRMAKTNAVTAVSTVLIALTVWCAPASAQEVTTQPAPDQRTQDPSIQRILAAPPDKLSTVIHAEIRNTPDPADRLLQLIVVGNERARAEAVRILVSQRSGGLASLIESLKGNSEAMSVLVEKAFSRDCQYASSVRQLLKHAPPRDLATPFLHRAMEKGDATDVLLVARYLMECEPGRPETISILSAAYADKRIREHRDSIARFLIARDRNFENTLLSLLDHPDPDLASSSLHFLGFMGRLRPDTIAEVVRRYPTLTGDSVRTATALLAQRDPKRLEEMLPNLPDGHLRYAVGSLIPDQPPQRAAFLIHYLNHESDAVRRAVFRETRHTDFDTPELSRMLLSIAENEAQPDYLNTLQLCGDRRPLGPVLSQRFRPVQGSWQTVAAVTFPRSTPQPWPTPEVAPVNAAPTPVWPEFCARLATYLWILPVLILWCVLLLLVLMWTGRFSLPSTAYNQLESD